MRGALHFIATLVIVPYVVMASAFLILGQAISSGSLLSFFDTLLAHAAWIVPWGVIGFGFGIVVIASLGLVARTRWIAACCLVLLAAGSLVTLVVGSSSKITEGLLFLVPCALVLMFAVWLVVVEQRSRRTSAGAD